MNPSAFQSTTNLMDEEGYLLWDWKLDTAEHGWNIVAIYKDKSRP